MTDKMPSRRLQLGFGGFPLDLGTSTTTQRAYEMFPIPSLAELSLMTYGGLETELSKWDKLDGVVWRLSGEDPLAFIWQLKLLGLLGRFESRSYAAAFWTMDSHHMLARERIAAAHFDHVFVAHVSYLGKFEAKSATFLPCSFSLAPQHVVEREVLAAADVPNGPKIGAYFANYPGQRRNTEFLRIRHRLDGMGVSNFLGVARGGSFPNQGIIQASLSNSVILNLSLRDDLNMRNFEALALNRILLTNKVPGHGLLEDFGQNIVFFDRDLGDFELRVRDALSMKSEDISGGFLRSHHLTQRIEKIIEVLRKRILTKDQDSVELSSTPLLTPAPVSGMAPPSLREYSQVELFISGGFNSLSARHVIELRGFIGWRAVPSMIFGAVTSGLFGFIRETIGAVSPLRAVARLILNWTWKNKTSI